MLSQTVNEAAKEKRISVFMKNLCIIDDVEADWIARYLPDLDTKRMKIGPGYWKEGKTFHTETHEEAMCFHFMHWKYARQFIFPRLKAHNTVERIEIKPDGLKVSCSSASEAMIYSIELSIERFFSLLGRLRDRIARMRRAS